jgi:Zn-dependent protease/predicted transcriptional regulator
MKWSWRIGRFAGIDVYIHTTFLLLVAFFGFTYWQQTRTLSGTLEGIAFLLALFLSVVLHEYGHALTARRYGIKARDITLLPIGGVARLERMPDKPLQELWVALAGPTVNIVIAVALFIYLGLSRTIIPLTGMTLTSGPFFERLLGVNLSLVVFNLIPAFPMDGGRVLRALLALRLDYVRATQIAATIGQGLAFLFGIIGLFGNPMLIFIALFVWIGAQQESSMVQMKSTLGGIPVRQAMLTEFKVLRPLDTLQQAVDHILAGTQQDFPVLEEERVVGVLTRSDLLTALSRHSEAIRVNAVMRRNFETVHPGDMLEAASIRLQACGCPVFPVLQDGRLVGLLTMENIGEFLMIKSALELRNLRNNTI